MGYEIVNYVSIVGVISSDFDNIIFQIGNYGMFILLIINHLQVAFIHSPNFIKKLN